MELRSISNFRPMERVRAQADLAGTQSNPFVYSTRQQCCAASKPVSISASHAMDDDAMDEEVDEELAEKLDAPMDVEAAAADDDVVFEADVVLSQPSPSSSLYLLQYPLRTNAVPIGTERSVDRVRLRPRYGRVELSLALHPSVATSSGTRETCAASFDSQQSAAHEKSIGRTQTLRSQPAANRPDANYAAAAFVKAGPRAAALVLAPLKSVVQLRPAFDYIDERAAAIARQKVDDKNARASARGERREEASEKTGETASVLQVQFRRRETERAAARRLSSHGALAKKEAEDSWVDLSFRHASESAPARARILGAGSALFEAISPSKRGPAGVSVVSANVEPDTNYMDLFQAHTRSVKIGVSPKGASVTEPLGLRHLQRLPANAAVAALVEFARVVRFEDMLRVAPAAAEAGEVLSAARIVAVCLRGCWVARAGPKRSKRGNERYDAARTLIHDLFRRGRVVKTHEAMDVLGGAPVLGEAHVKAVLGEVARRKRGVGWVFKTEDDLLFEEEYSVLVEAQGKDWDRRVAMAANTLGLRRGR